MGQLRRSATATVIGLGSLVLMTAPGLATDDRIGGDSGSTVQLAHMGQMQSGYAHSQPCPMGMMGQGMMQGSDNGPRQGHGAGRQMGDPGKMGSRMMGSERGPQGMMGPGFGNRVVANRDLSVDDVRHFFEHRLEMRGNKRLQVGDVKEVDKDKIIADITTVDGSLVQRLEVDRHSGQVEHVD